MSRMTTTQDAFGAVAEPSRRAIMALLADGEQGVNDVAARLQVRQPQASKHLKVLHDVGLVKVRQVGRRRLYRLDGEGIRVIHDWVSEFEHLWNERFDRLDAYLKELTEQEDG